MTRRSNAAQITSRSSSNQAEARAFSALMSSVVVVGAVTVGVDPVAVLGRAGVDHRVAVVAVAVRFREAVSIDVHAAGGLRSSGVVCGTCFDKELPKFGPESDYTLDVWTFQTCTRSVPVSWV